MVVGREGVQQVGTQTAPTVRRHQDDDDDEQKVKVASRNQKRIA